MNRAESLFLRPGAVLVHVAMLLALVVPPAAAAVGRADYERMLEARFSAPVAVVSGGAEIAIDDIHLFLDSGTVSWMEPVADGAVTGLVFEGQGRTRIPVADPVELRQLRRFAARSDLEGVYVRFDRLVARTSRPELFARAAPAAVVAGASAGGFAKSALAADRFDEWRRRHGYDADARVVAGLLHPGDTYLRADLYSEEFGWLTVEYDGLRPEEISVSKLKAAHSIVESWLSLDRERDRTPAGRPGSQWRDESLSLLALDAKVNATRLGSAAAGGAGEVHPLDARFVATVTYQVRTESLGALLLALSPEARVERVVDSAGRELEYLRYHLGGLKRNISDRLYDASLVVLLPEPVGPGEEIAITFEYEMEIPGFVSLLSWYPTPRDLGFGESHQVSLELTHRNDYGCKATGRLVEQRRTDDGTVTSFRTAEPVHAAAFTLARAPHEQSYRFEGLPEVVMFGTRGGYLSADKIEGFSGDIINAVNFFQDLFASPVRAKQLNVTLIAAGHGQAGEGLIQASDGIALAAVEGRAMAGAREAFLAHEVAHEWWGHQLTWASYRDQWLSEGLAEYSAMLFVEASLDGGEKLFRQILEAHNNELIGSIRSAFGSFARPGLALMNQAGRERMGPIGLGYRAGTAEAPAAYLTMTYTKGAMVIHMLRSILRVATGSDQVFFDMLRDFVATFQGRAVATADLQATLTRHAPSDWTWFFDQWVYSTEIPTYTSSYKIAKAEGGGWEVRLSVTQSGVPEGFRMPVPVRAEFAGGRTGEVLVTIDGPQKDVVIPVPDKPRKVVFNPDHAVIARMN